MLRGSERENGLRERAVAPLDLEMKFSLPDGGSMVHDLADRAVRIDVPFARGMERLGSREGQKSGQRDASDNAQPKLH